MCELRGGEKIGSITTCLRALEPTSVDHMEGKIAQSNDCENRVILIRIDRC